MILYTKFTLSYNLTKDIDNQIGRERRRREKNERGSQEAKGG